MWSPVCEDYRLAQEKRKEREMNMKEKAKLNKKVFKYPLDAVTYQFIRIPSTNILSVAEQGNNMVVYALVDTEIAPVQYEFAVIGTGHTILQDIDAYNFLGTVKLHDGKLMFHVFYRALC